MLPRLVMTLASFLSHRTYTFSVAPDLSSGKDGEASSRRNGDPQPPRMSRSISSLQSLQVMGP